jgi:hypothetical protein
VVEIAHFEDVEFGIDRGAVTRVRAAAVVNAGIARGGATALDCWPMGRRPGISPTNLLPSGRRATAAWRGRQLKALERGRMVMNHNTRTGCIARKGPCPWTWCRREAAGSPWRVGRLGFMRPRRAAWRSPALAAA